MDNTFQKLSLSAKPKSKVSEMLSDLQQ
jgi:Inner centromere protein, ARK binding region